MNKESHSESHQYSSPTQILSPYFKKIRTFSGLQNQEKKLYTIISKFFDNSDVVHPLSQLAEFLETHNGEELSWKMCFMILCLFLDHQTIRGYTQISVREVSKTTNNENNSTELNNKRRFDIMKDKESHSPIKKKSKKDILEKTSHDNFHQLLYKYLLAKLENIKSLYYNTFKTISNETEISDKSIIMERSFYELIGLKYTYYTTSFFNTTSSNVKRLLSLNNNFGDSIEMFDQINFWCIERIKKREFISSTINSTVDDDLKSILHLPFDTTDTEIINKCDILLKWLFLPVEDSPSSEKVFKSYTKLKEARRKWDSYSSVNNCLGKKSRAEQMYSAKSNFQKFVIEFVLDRHNEQQNNWYNPFWTLGIDPKKFKIDEMSIIKKKLMLFTHPDKILEKKMKEKAKEAYIIIRDSLELIKKLCKTNSHIIESLPKGPEMSYDFNLYFERYLNGQDKLPEILEVNVSIIKVDGKETVKLPPRIRVCAKFNELVTNAKLNVYLTLPFVGSNALVEKSELMKHVFTSYLLETDNKSDKEDIQINLSENRIYFEISNLLYSGYPGTTEITYYIGLQVVGHELSSKTIWKKIKTKLPTECEIIKGFSKNGIKSYLELYCKTLGDERKSVQNIFSAAELWNIIDNTSRKTDLIKVLISLMENSYKNIISSYT